MNHLLLILMLVYRIVGVQSLSNGAPVENCRSMRPQHDFQHDPNAPVLPEIDPSPFTFEASESYSNSSNSIFNGQYSLSTSCICNKYILNTFISFGCIVTLSSKNSEIFKGYFIQARSITDAKEDAIIGTFQLVEDDKFSKLMNCLDGTEVTSNI